MPLRRMPLLALASTLVAAAAAAPALAGVAVADQPTAVTAPVLSTAERGCSPAARFTFTPRTGTYKQAPIRTQSVAGVALCPQTAGVPGFVTSVRVNAAAQLTTWKRAWDTVAGGPGPLGSFERTNRTIVNIPGLIVLQGDAYADLGGAHGISLKTYDILNPKTGSVVTTDGMLVEMQTAGGPNWNFERELNAWAPHGAYPAVDRSQVSMYPARAGMHIAVGMCQAYACAAGVVEYTIPWDRLVGPGEDMSFIPNAWGY